MMGKSHIVLNSAITASALVWLNTLRDRDSIAGEAVSTWSYQVVSSIAGVFGLTKVPEWASEAPVSSGAQWLWAWLFPQWGEPWWMGWYLPIALMLFLIGSVLPDTDSPNSILGRYLPSGWAGPHRGATHTDWVLLGMFALSLIPGLRFMIFLWLGTMLHDEVDGLSTAGRARFWPLGKWKIIRYGGGPSATPCVVRVGRHFRLYSAGHVAEGVLLGVVLAGSAALLIAGALLGLPT